MTNHVQIPSTGSDAPTPHDTNDNVAPPEHIDFKGHLGRTLHLTLEQHGAYVILETLIERHGFHEVLDDAALIALICHTLRCTPEYWHDNIAPAIVPILEIGLEKAA
jgi:hypothetical protein